MSVNTEIPLSTLQLESTLLNIKADITARLASTKTLFEQLNTSQWNPNDVRTYRNLIEERRQLEIDHHKSSTRDVALRGGQRKATDADLGDPSNSKFRYDSEYATYRYYGDNACVLDEVKSCSHDLCRRAVSEGLSYLEYDTMIHYELRIAAAKTTRMKEALKKQRDVQLAKDIQDTEAWKDKCIKKMASFGKEANEAIIKAASRITGWQLSSIDIELTPDTPTEQVGRGLSALRAKTLDNDPRLFGDVCLNRIRTTARDQIWWKLPSQYIEYLSPIRIDHLEAAIATLRRVFDTNAMIYYEPHSCLKGFLKDFRELMRWTQLPHRKTYVGSTVGEALDDIKVALSMEDMQASLPPSKTEEPSQNQAPKNALHKALKSCLELENRAQMQMWRIQDQSILCESNPENGLAEVKRKCIQESPIPSVTKIAVGRLEIMNREYCAVSFLLAKAATGLSAKELVSTSMDHVWKMVGDDWMKLVPTCHNLRSALAARRRDELEKPDNGRALEQLNKALIEIEKEIRVLDAEYSQKLVARVKQVGTNIEACVEPLVTRVQQQTSDMYLLPGMLQEGFQEEAGILISRYAKGFNGKTELQITGKAWREIISQNMSRGVGEAFRVFKCVHDHNMSAGDNTVLKSILDQSHQTTNLLFKYTDDLGVFWYQQYCSGRCLPSAFTHLLAALPNVSVFNSNTANVILDTLSTQSSTLRKSRPPSIWEPDMEILSRIFLQVHGYITVEAMYSFGRADVAQVALSIIYLLAFGTIMVKSSEIATSNLDFILSFTELIFERPLSDSSTSCISHIKTLVQNFIDCETIRCCGSKSCTEQTWLPAAPLESLFLNDLTQMQKHEVKSQPTLLETVIHPKSGRKQHVESMLQKHKRILSGLIEMDIKKLSELEKHKLLKYCAYQVKLLNSASQRRQKGFHSSQADPELVRLLWQNFLRIEQADYSDDPSSLNIGMHNQCNIWELVDSGEKNKVIGFMEGYRAGYRMDADLVKLAWSCKEYAITNGKRDPVIAFRQRRGRLRQLAGELPEQLEKHLNEQNSQLEDICLEHPTRLRATYSWLEYMYQCDPNFSRLDMQYIFDMLDMDEPQFVTLTDALRTEIAINDGIGAVTSFSEAVANLLESARSAKYIAGDSPDLKAVHEAACKAWNRSLYEDMIFSEDEEDEKDKEDDQKNDTVDEAKNSCTLVIDNSSDESLSEYESECEEVAPLRVNIIKQPSRNPGLSSTIQGDTINGSTSEFNKCDATKGAANISQYWEHLSPDIGYRIDSDRCADIIYRGEVSSIKASEVAENNDLKIPEAEELNTTIPYDQSPAESLMLASDNAIAVPLRYSTAVMVENGRISAETPQHTQVPKDTATDTTNIKTQSESRAKNIPSAEEHKSYNSLLCDQILNLKTSLTSTKAAMNADKKKGSLLTLVRFQQLQLKTELAELQCEYMLKTLTSRMDELHGVEDSKKQDLLNKIEKLNQLIKVSSGSEHREEMGGEAA